MAFPWAAIISTVGAGISTLVGARSQTGAINRAREINTGGTDRAMQLIMGMYDEGQSSLAPYRNVGPAALNNLQAQANRGRVPAPASVRPQTPINAMARSATATPSQSGGSIQNAMVTNAQGKPVSVAGDRAKGAIKNSMIGTGIGFGAAAGIGAALGGTTMLGAVGGPIGMGLAAAGGLIASQFGKNNPDKLAASRGINEVSKLIWGTNTPGIPLDQLTEGIVADVVKGRKTAAQGRKEARDLLLEWAAGMKSAGLDPGVVQKSIQTQKEFFRPLGDLFNRLGAGGAPAQPKLNSGPLTGEIVPDNQPLHYPPNAMLGRYQEGMNHAY